MINISNTMVESILNKTKLSRTDLSTLYKKIQELKLNISWLDLFRKSSRETSLSTLQQAIKPKPKKTNQLKELLKTIKNTKPESNDYYILSIQFTDGSKKHTTITPQSPCQKKSTLITLNYGQLFRGISCMFICVRPNT